MQELERLQHLKDLASEDVRTAFDAAKSEGYDTSTLRVVLKLRKMTPDQRRERRALEAIYMAALGMLEGDPLPDEARRRLDGPHEDRQPDMSKPDQQHGNDAASAPESPRRPEQPALVLKDPDEARKEGSEAAAAGKRIYDNPYPAGDPCRAAWDEGWCAQSRSHGMDTPAAYQRRTDKPPKKDSDGESSDQDSGADDAQRGAA